MNKLELKQKANEVVKEINKVLGFNFKLSCIEQKQWATYWFDDENMSDDDDNEDNHMYYVFQTKISSHSIQLNYVADYHSHMPYRITYEKIDGGKSINKWFETELDLCEFLKDMLFK